MRHIYIAFSLAASLTLGAGMWAVGCGSDNPNNGVDGGSDQGVGTDLAQGTVSCTAYCNEMALHCTGDIPVSTVDAGGLSQYTNMASCLNECAALPVGKFGDTSGNTAGCRLYHGGALAAADPTTHCPHAGPTGGGVCGTDRCATFCGLVMQVCTPANNVNPVPFTSMTDCMNKCGQPPYKFDPTLPELIQDTPTLNCAYYHLGEAFASANPDAGATAQEHCADFVPSNPGRGCQ